MTSRFLELWIGTIALLTLAGCTQVSPSQGGTRSLLANEAVNTSRADCLRELGWEVELKQGAIIVELTDEGRDRYVLDSAECLRDAGIDPDAAITDEQYADAYEWYSDIAACLATAGWDVPKKPSFSTFTSMYDSDPWIPWSRVPDEDAYKASQTCPVLEGPQAAGP